MLFSLLPTRMSHCSQVTNAIHWFFFLFFIFFCFRKNFNLQLNYFWSHRILFMFDMFEIGFVTEKNEFSISIFPVLLTSMFRNCFYLSEKVPLGLHRWQRTNENKSWNLFSFFALERPFSTLLMSGQCKRDNNR